MKLLSKCAVPLVIALVASPSLVLAGRAVPNGYGQFVVSAADKAAMINETDRTCMARAMTTPNDLGPQIACNTAMSTRLDARVKDANTWRLRGAPSRAYQQAVRGQNDWAANRRAVCETKWAGELNPSSNSFGLAVSQCVSEETYRRALWIERLRR